MNISTINFHSLDNLNPEAIMFYLRKNKWKMEQSIDSGTIWSNILNDGRIARVLIPASSDIPDFNSRIYDLIRTVSAVEERPESEVLASIETSLQISQQQKKQVVRLRLTSGTNKNNSIPAKRLGPLLVNFQSLINAIAQYEEGRATDSGSIPKYITDETQFSVASTFKGSFGITLVNEPLTEIHQQDLLREPLTHRALRSFMSLLEASKSEQSLQENLSRIKKRAASNYRNFLLTLLDNKTDNIIEWGSHENNEYSRVELSLSEVNHAYEITSRTVVEIPNEFELERVEWIGGNSRRQDFEIVNIDTNETYTGRISAEAMVQAQQAIWHGIYTATLREEAEIIQSTEQRIIRHTLLSIKPFISSGND